MERSKFNSTSEKILISSCLLLVLLVNIPKCHAEVETVSITREQEKFFEAEIRPLFSDYCYQCHSSKKQEAGLRLDIRQNAMKGGESGLAIVSGQPSKSLLIESVNYEGYEMPPNKKLPEEKIALLTKWVKMGAPWPADSKETIESGKSNHEDYTKAIWRASKSHWSFQPVQKPEVPVRKSDQWGNNEVDRFVFEKMKAGKLTPSPRAEPRVLMRRAYLDLLGMPPTQKETEQFLNDRSQDRFTKLINRLLEDPRYGERWARHWLDVVRYADSKGAIFGEPKQYPYAYTYRDYVVNSFQNDKPFDQFVREQVAADQLSASSGDPSLAALGFLTVHKRSNAGGDEAEWVDRVDTLGRGILGLTIACARCHDHKYDPIRTEDFYSLYGVFASVEEPDELPIISRPEEGSEMDIAYKKFVDVEDKKINDFKKTSHQKLMKQSRDEIGKYLYLLSEGRDLEEREFRVLAGQKKLNPHIALQWKSFLAKKQNHEVLGAWQVYSKISKADFAAHSPALTRQIVSNQLPDCLLNPLVSKLFTQAPRNLQDVAAKYQSLFLEIDDKWSLNENTEKLEDEYEDQIQKFLYAKTSPCYLEAENFKKLSRPVYLELLKLNEKRDLVLGVHPGAPRRAMIVRDKKTLYEPYVYLRGNKDRKGNSVPRQYPEVLSAGHPTPFQNGSGRLELANKLASNENPLTARVFVNRIWLWHFGKGLVETPSDFGHRAERPVHHELLDWLSSSFMENNWSTKSIHRLLMNSATYQQASFGNEEKSELDPENRLLWRFHRRRLEFEAMRDSMLHVSGKLDLTRGGPAIDLLQYNAATSGADFQSEESNSFRRTIYGAIRREKLPPLLFTFDFANPDESSPKRGTTTVPTQSLFLLNGKFTMEMASALIKRPEIHSASNPQDRIRQLFLTVLNREPSQNELIISEDFLDREELREPARKKQVVWKFGYAPYKGKQIELLQIHPFPYFENNSMQGSKSYPDNINNLGWLRMGIKGGNPSTINSLVASWTSPADGLVSCSGELKHSTKNGNGVRASIYKQGQFLKDWDAHNNKFETSLKNIAVLKGERIDLVVDGRGSGAYDSYQWNAKLILSNNSASGKSSSEDYSLNDAFEEASNRTRTKTKNEIGPWERLAQVLLISNEFLFIE